MVSDCHVSSKNHSEETKPHPPNHFPQPPINFDRTPTSLEEEAVHLIHEIESVVNNIVSSSDIQHATFSNTIQPFINMENQLWSQSRLIKFYASSNPNEQLREASNKASKLFANAEINLYLRSDFYRLVKAVVDKGEPLLKDEEYYLNKLRQDFEKNGVGITDEQKRGHLKKIQGRIKDLTREALKNLNGNGSGLWLTADELRGLPEDFIARCPVRSQESELSSEKLEFWIRMKDPDTTPVLKYAVNPETRKRVYLANENRCPENIPLYTEIFALRREAAQLLGFETHAAYRTHYKMLQNVGVIHDFLAEVWKQSISKRDDDKTVLEAFKSKEIKELGDLDSTDGKLGHWDRHYYDRVSREQENGLDQNAIAEYFPLESTLQGMFRIYEHIFGIRFSSINPEKSWTWHESVKMFAVWDTDQTQEEFLGFLYLDLFPRPAKYTHAGHYGLSPGFTASTQERHYPSAALVMNLPSPTVTKPSLLAHSDLRRLFHELGHGMHNLLSKTQYARFHGTTVDKDFVEAPSMLFENFLWTPQHMQEISCHYSHLSPVFMETWRSEKIAKGETTDAMAKQIPIEIVEKLVETKHSNDSLRTMVILFQSLFDMTVHSQTDHDLSAEELGSLYNNLRAEVTGFCGVEFLSDDVECHGWSAFRSIMGSYDAGYYTYLLSRIYSDDLFSTGFKGNTMDQARGRRYRYMVLEPGGSQSEMETMTVFLGRAPDTRAFCEEHGFEMPGAFQANGVSA